LFVDDVIITKDSEDPFDIAVPAIVKKTSPALLCGYHLSFLRSINKKILGAFLFWSLKDDSIASQLHREATGITRWAISSRNIKNSILPFPPKDEQIIIIEYLEHLSQKTKTVKLRIEKQIETLKTFRKSLIHECVTGKKQIYKGEIKTR
jgi:type I restriction enzyme S subunit